MSVRSIFLKSEGNLNRPRKNDWCQSRSSAKIGYLTSGRQKVKSELHGGSSSGFMTHRIISIYVQKGSKKNLAKKLRFTAANIVECVLRVRVSHFLYLITNAAADESLIWNTFNNLHCIIQCVLYNLYIIFLSIQSK